MSASEAWPALPYQDWQESCTTLHLWTQIVGKVRLVCSPWINHSWHATLYPQPRGLTTGTLAAGDRVFQIDFDLADHGLVVSTAEGWVRRMPLEGQTVASFYRGLMDTLEELELPVAIHDRPSEMEDPVPFAEDERGGYDGDAAWRFLQVILQSERVMRRFRSRFLGKCSPVHLFWGALDLAVTRFSGRPAPEHPGGFPSLPDPVTREAYSHEVSSAGFFPGAGLGYPAYYSYAYPTPDGFAEADVGPADAFWSEEMGEFFLPYDAVRTAGDPEAALLEFLQSTYAAAAKLAGWDREALEREEGAPVGVRVGA